jgi:hypothetical protein
VWAEEQLSRKGYCKTCQKTRVIGGFKIANGAGMKYRCPVKIINNEDNDTFVESFLGVLKKILN